MAVQNNAMQKILNKALGDPRTSDLLDHIRRQIPINYEWNDDAFWGAHFENGGAVITVAQTGYPSAALVHELLHIDLQLKGYRRPSGFLSDIVDLATFKRLMTCLDNELQHQRMFAPFCSMNFRSNQFYADSDVGTHRFLLNELAKAQGRIERAIHFFTLIAPGGAMSESGRNQLRQKFRTVDGGLHEPVWIAIEAIVERWKNDTSFDVTPYLKEILLTLAPTTITKPHRSWITFDPATDGKLAFPGAGEFVEGDFTLEDLKV
ncbi:hypothetical protein [Stenotrophomonas maltophilia]|uniref:hypothetical protein n=1 Tax=Stenotrophomonas maltophilia TaxID=40324 RepID=UPI001655C4E3|nr:hypothetical protein [Stenotrophomonas maltophilia]MBC8774710.1 hypothetical protein [Stenotrophomonas maltophilia]